MKKLILIISLLISGLCSANAQKGKPRTDVMANPNKVVARILPDLTFDLVPVLVGGSNSIQKVEGIPGRLKMTVNYIVKNIGFADSKPTSVYAEYSYMGTQRVAYDIRESIIHIRSNPISLQAIEKGKDILRKDAFVFNTTPDQAYGKELKMRLVIVFTGTNNQNEISVANNSSDELTLTMINK